MNIKVLIDQAKSYQEQLPNKVSFATPKSSEIAGWIDHTLLKPQATIEEVAQVCQEAREYHFASVALNPIYTPQAVVELKKSGVRVCNPIGFPLGGDLSKVKIAESKAAIEAGADELDMVLAIGFLKSGCYESVYDDIASVVETCHKHKVLAKVILENCYLDRFEKIIACLLAKEAEADFVKTSTGFGPGGATLEDVALMRSVVGGPEEMGVKAAGGIHTWTDVKNLIEAGANRIGTSSGVQIVAQAVQGEQR
jgi:deoxyribose-phosphate aldolase